MAKLLEVYKCDLCGNIVEVFHAGAGELVCCGEAMKYQEEKTADASKEKHVPFVEKIEGGFKVRIGEETEHPMTAEHYIEWIEIIADNKVYRQNLKPGEKPEAVFMIDAEKVVAREYCNIHGHWKN
ncbi:desulfoferrodoxin [Ilyobacter sp.]|jgi:superoxide reductase|uniref:desulfoferrodoxin n=1 Tax=Ilyobacter sp. TaxID=3100343 RepID=UPI0035691C56